MADYGVFVGFGYPARGREAAATKVFQELLQYLGQQQQMRTVESFEPTFLQPHGGDLGGFVLARGERAKLDAMVASPEFQRLVTRAQTIVDNFGVVNCTFGQEAQRQVGTFLQDINDLI